MNKNIYEKLQYVQEHLSVPKNQRNTFGNYNYRSLEDITEALKPLLAEVDAYIVMEDEVMLIGDRYYVKATVKFADANTFITSKAFAREALSKKGMDESQITGSTSSYARKYAMNGLLVIDDTKDADATNTHGKNGNQENPQGQNTKPTQKTKPTPKVKQNEVVDMAFLAFEAKHQAILTEEPYIYFEFDRGKFEKAIIKHFKALPTRKTSVDKIVTTIKPEEVLIEKPTEAA